MTVAYLDCGRLWCLYLSDSLRFHEDSRTLDLDLDAFCRAGYTTRLRMGWNWLCSGSD